MSRIPNCISSLTEETPPSGLRRRVRAAKAKVGKCVPMTAKDGFNHGRSYGHKFVERDFSYGVGAAVGFGFGAVEAVVDLAAAPTNWLVSLYSKASA